MIGWLGRRGMRRGVSWRRRSNSLFWGVIFVRKSLSGKDYNPSKFDVASK